MTQTPTRSLHRSLDIGSATFLGLGSIFGTGVFVSIGLAAAITGPSVILAIILAGLLATCNALSSAQLAAAHPVSGGTYEYGYRYIAPSVGFTAGWLFLLAKSASAATAALGTVYYLTRLTGLSSEINPAFLACALTVLMTLLVLSGLRRSNGVNIVIVTVTLVALIALIIFAGLSVDQTTAINFEPFFTTETDKTQAFLYATALMFVAYTGYGRIATMGEEVRDPKRTIPRAIILTLIVSALIYCSVAVAAIAALGADGLASTVVQSGAPLEAAAAALSVPGLSTLLAIGAITAMVGVLLNLILGLSRVTLAMARRRDLPRGLSFISDAGSPRWAVVFVGTIVAGLSLIGNIETTWSFSAFTVLIYYAITNIAALRLPKADRLYHPAISIIGLLGCLGLAAFIPVKIMVIGLGLIATGLCFRHVMQIRPGNQSP